MASAEHLLISKVIQENDIGPVIEAGIKAQHFSTHWEGVWLWVTNYWREHSAVPSPRVLAQEYADVQVLDAGREQFSNLIEEVLTSYKHNKLVETLSMAVPLLNINNTEEALQALLYRSHHIDFAQIKLLSSYTPFCKDKRISIERIPHITNIDDWCNFIVYNFFQFNTFFTFYFSFAFFY